MNDTLRIRLAEYALGTLPAEHVAEVLAQLTSDPSARQVLAELEADMCTLSGALPPMTPRPAARSRLLASVEPVKRLLAMTDRVSDFLGVDRAHARMILDLVDDAGAWVSAPVDGISLCDVDGGEAVAGARVGLVRLRPKTTFPTHTHLGLERTLVLQGGYVDSSGQTHLAGDVVHNPAASRHTFTALDGPDLLYLVALWNGIDLAGLD